MRFLNFLWNKKPLSKKEESAIVSEIKDAESRTSAEIRLHIGKLLIDNNALETAKFIFTKTGMDNTIERNGVLIFISLKERKFAILGDEGINKKVGENYWADIKNEMQVLFENQRIIEGLTHGIKKIGEKLALHFPPGIENPNELSDEISLD